MKVVTLAAGEEACGEVSLEERFEGWGEARARGDVHLFWAWQVRLMNVDTWITGGKTIVGSTSRSE
jgi:hypothetical protein